MTDSPAHRGNHPDRAVWALAAWTVAARLFFIAIWPNHVYSVDLRNWQFMAGAMLVGINPYVGNRLLNWPPMWMEMLYALGRVSDQLDWPFITCVRVFLTAADLVLVLSTWKLLQLLDLRRHAFRPVLWGLCLNPLLILLTVQQGNFDVIPTILILWFLQSLIRFCRSGNPVDWLLAAAWLGLGGFAKTFPLMLAPILFAESRRLNAKTRVLGAAFCFAPAILSLAPLYALYPRDIAEGVLFYRGTPGTAGLSGILNALGGRPAMYAYAPFFTLGLLLALIVTTLLLWRRPPRRDADLIPISLLLLMGIFLFGPGCSVQYWYWVAPLLVVCYLTQSPALGRLILPAAIVIVLTETVVFAYQQVLGFFLFRWMPNSFNEKMYDWFSTERHIFFLSLPMTITAILLWLAVAGSVIAPAKNPPGQQ